MGTESVNGTERAALVTTLGLAEELALVMTDGTERAALVTTLGLAEELALVMTLDLTLVLGRLPVAESTSSKEEVEVIVVEMLMLLAIMVNIHRTNK